MKYLMMITSLFLIVNCAGRRNTNESVKSNSLKPIPRIPLITTEYIPVKDNRSKIYLKIAKEAFSKKYPLINLDSISSGNVSQLSTGNKIQPKQAIKVTWIKFKQPMSRFGGIEVEEEAEVVMSFDYVISSIRYQFNKGGFNMLSNNC